MTKLRVLIACEFSGTVRRAFRDLGHDAYSCDLLSAEDGSPFHYQGDVRQVLGGKGVFAPMGLVQHPWDLMIAHPPYTRLTNSGVRWLNERNLWGDLDEAAAFFKSLLKAPIPHIAIENPIPHKYAVDRIGRTYDQLVQPYMFGHGETKATCFWLKNLPHLVPTDTVEGRLGRIHKLPPGPDRWKERSRTYSGIAAAIARQWGDYVAAQMKVAA